MALDLFLCRHGETEWTLSGQHTSFSDISLTERGKKQIALLAPALHKITWNLILSSPSRRAVESCLIAGLAPTLEPLAVEWNYGKYEGLTHVQIEAQNPNWNLFRDGAPGGESVQQVGQRADDLLKMIMQINGSVLLFSHGHFLRVLVSRWLELQAGDARLFTLSVASISHLGFERKQKVIRFWNNTCHLSADLSGGL